MSPSERDPRDWPQVGNESGDAETVRSRRAGHARRARRAGHARRPQRQRAVLAPRNPCVGPARAPLEDDDDAGRRADGRGDRSVSHDSGIGDADVHRTQPHAGPRYVRDPDEIGGQEVRPRSRPPRSRPRGSPRSAWPPARRPRQRGSGRPRPRAKKSTGEEVHRTEVHEARGRRQEGRGDAEAEDHGRAEVRREEVHRSEVDGPEVDEARGRRQEGRGDPEAEDLGRTQGHRRRSPPSPEVDGEEVDRPEVDEARGRREEGRSDEEAEDDGRPKGSLAQHSLTRTDAAAVR